MKNSNVEWIGQIPDDWKLERLQWHLDEINESNNPIKTNQVLSLTNRLGVIPYEEKGDHGNKAKENVDEYKIAYPNTIVANCMNVLIGSVGICNHFGCVSPVYYVFKPKKNENIEFLNYIFQTTQFQKELRKFANGILEIRLRVSSDDILKREVALPNLELQTKIVKYLNKKCSEIDQLIEIENQQIEKLKEYKQAVITEAVTKGLDKNVKLKESGVEWIGKIPENWDVCKIKYIADPKIENSFIDGDWIESGDISLSGIQYYTIGNISDGCFKYQGNSYITEETFKKLNCKYAFAGDLVFSRLNEPYGRSCIIPKEIEKCVLAVDIVILRPKKTFNKNYLCYFTQCPNYQHFVETKSRGTAMKRISRNNLGDVYVTQPSRFIQDKIVTFLDKKCFEIDSLIEIKNKKIENLQQYKKSMIYEYVTGKKEVK